MLTNADITIYNRSKDPSTGNSKWNRQYVPMCWWYEDTQSEITTKGLESADILTVRIPDPSIEIKKDDYIVKGDCQIEMQTVKDLQEHKYYRVTKTNYNMFGRNPHIKVVGI